MNPVRSDEPEIELPRGEVEIIPPGQSGRAGGERAPFGYETNSRSRTFVFSSRSGGIVSTVLVALGVLALFALLLGTFAVVAGVAALVFAGFYLRASIRRWLGRQT